MVNTSLLSERRKADRVKMAALLVEAITQAGGTAIVDGGWTAMFPNEVMVRIAAPGGAYISVDFDGKSSQPDVHVATWNTADGVYLAPGAFGGAEVNPFHLGKVNRVARGIDDLCVMLVRDVRRFVDGSGYAPADHPVARRIEAARIEREKARAEWAAANPEEAKKWPIAA